MLEMLITCAIIGVLAAAAIPAFSVWYPNHRLKSAARLIFSDLQLAKLQAVRANGEYRVVFDPASGRYQIISLGADEEYGTMDDVVEKTVVLVDEFGGDVVFGHGNATQSATKTPGPLPGDHVSYSSPMNVATFNARGIGNAGYVYIANTRNQSYAVGTSSAGAILLKKWNDSASKWD